MGLLALRVNDGGMATAHVSKESLVVNFTTAEKIAGVLRDIELPLSAVRSARVVPDGLTAATGMRAPGLALPGYNKSGTWRRQGRHSVVVVRRGRPALRVELSGHRYSDLLIDVDNAVELARTLSAAPQGKL
jgi:hypothetical protein